MSSIQDDLKLEGTNCTYYENLLTSHSSNNIYIIVPLPMGSMLIMRKSNNTVESIILDNDNMGQYGNNSDLIRYNNFTNNYTEIKKN